MDELNVLRHKVRNQQERIAELQAKSMEVSATAGTPLDTNPVTVMMHLLEEKDKQLEAYAKAAITSKVYILYCRIYLNYCDQASKNFPIAYPRVPKS
jgi:hypothetical protein